MPREETATAHFHVFRSQPSIRTTSCSAAAMLPAAFLLLLILTKDRVAGNMLVASLSSYPDPRRQPQGCGADNASLVCDPDRLLRSDQRKTLERTLTGYMATCQCGFGCQKNESVAILFIISSLPSSGPANRSEMERNGLHLARLASIWRQQLRLDPCNRDLLLFASQGSSATSSEFTYNLFIDPGPALSRIFTAACVSELKSQAYNPLHRGNITGAIDIILTHARYIGIHQVACRGQSMHSMGGVSLEISLAIITAVAIFMLVSCVLLSRLCQGMDSALLARARLMIFHPDHDKQLLSQVYDSIQFNTDDITVDANAVLAHPPSAAALADGKATTALTEIRPRATASTSQTQKAQEVASSEVQLHTAAQDATYKSLASSSRPAVDSDDSLA